jgi:hypothetical protein
MARAFTVDRSNRLTPGLVLDRERHDDLDPPELQPHVDELFPDGVTAHGNGYFLAGGQAATLASPNIELVFEYVRRARFQEAPSRFESVFGCEDAPSAETFQTRWGDPGASIWEVEFDGEPFEADMTCLTLQGSILMASYAAERYWSSEENGFAIYGLPTAPFWELLLPPPVKVLAKVV